MKIETAVTLEIGKMKQPIVIAYQIGLIISALYKNKIYQGEKLSFLKREYPQRDSYTYLIQRLIDSGVLRHSPEASHDEIFTVLSQTTPSAEEIACCVDPFCYVSHLSAMEYHGLTDRFSKVLFLTAPKQISWKQLAKEKMEKDLGLSFGSYINAGLPKLKHLRLKKISRKVVSTHISSHYNPGSYVITKGKALRVSSIGRTFLDMIRNPSLCGGIYHVLNVFSQNAARYLHLIIGEVQQHGTHIDKVRVGYILDERLGLDDPHIETWKASVQRGGSRKLSSENPYLPIFSEKWCLSINIEEVEE